MNGHIQHKDIHRLLHLLRSRDLSKEEWRQLEAYAANDPFLLDAVEGLRQVPSETRVSHIQSILSKLAIEQQKRSRILGLPPMISLAASVLLLVGMFWLVNHLVSPVQNQLATNTADEEGGNYKISSNGSDSSLYTDAMSTESDVEIQQPTNMPLARDIPSKPPVTSEKKRADGVEQYDRPKGSAPIDRKKEHEDIVSSEAEVVENSRNQKDALPSPATSGPRILSDFTDQNLNSNFVPFPEVKGIVLNYVGEPLGGAQIQMKGTALQTQTDYLGNFALDIPNQNYRNALVISHQGYPPVEADVADGDSIVVRLQENVPAGESNITTFMQKRMTTTNGPDTRSLAQPVSGERTYNKYLRQNLRYPTQASDAGIRGSVILEFDISSDGLPLNFRIVKSLGFGCDEEAIRLIREGPKWNHIGAQVSIGRWEVEF